jgi:chaperone modulatory protein CbpM
MTKRTASGILLDERVHYSLDEVCQVCAIQTEWVIELVEQGILQPTGERRREWRFSGTNLHTAMKAQRLQQDLNLNLSGVALVLELLDEIENLKSRLHAIEVNDS